MAEEGLAIVCGWAAELWGLRGFRRAGWRRGVESAGGVCVQNVGGYGEGMLANWGRRECICLLYTSPSPRDRQKSRMPSSA